MDPTTTFYLDHRSDIPQIKDALEKANEAGGNYDVVGRYLGVQLRMGPHGMYVVDGSGRLDRCPIIITELPVREVMIEIPGTGTADEWAEGTTRFGGVCVRVRKWRSENGIPRWDIQVVAPTYEKAMAEVETFFPTRFEPERAIWRRDQVEAEQLSHGE